MGAGGGSDGVGGYLQPQRLADALAAAADTGDGPVVPLAGCTDLFPATEAASLHDGHRGVLLDLTCIPDLRRIEMRPEGVRIGAAVTWAEVIAAPLPPALDGLKAAARTVGSVQIQSAGTIGGNICNASPAADGMPCLLTLDALVELASLRGVRQMPLAAFVTGPRRTLRAADEILTAVILPQAALAGQGRFLKLGTRAHLVISIVMVATRIAVHDGRIAAAALSVGACSPVAVRLPAQERALVGLTPDRAARAIDPALVGAALSPIDDVRADAAYRGGAAVELLARALAGGGAS